MKGKIVLVTGANGGLGTSVTQAFLDAGATVVGVSKTIEQSMFNAPGFVAMPGDLSSGASAAKIVAEITSRFERLDVLAHTVGGFAGGETIAEMGDATFQRMLSMNLTSTFYMLRAAIPAMRKHRGGRIIAIGSRAALEPGARVGAYSASKAAMVSLIRTVALENKDVTLTANALLPGTMDTPANRQAMPKADFSRWVQPGAVASLVLWLASDAGQDVNGALIPVYGAEV